MRIDSVTRSRDRNSLGLLSSELFEQVARFREDRTQLFQQEEVIRRRRTQPIIASSESLLRRAPRIDRRETRPQSEERLHEFARRRPFHGLGGRYASDNGRQDSHSWGYGDCGDRAQTAAEIVQPQESGLNNADISNPTHLAIQQRSAAAQSHQTQGWSAPALQAPSHGLSALRTVDEDMESSKSVPANIEDFDESNPFRIF